MDVQDLWDRLTEELLPLMTRYRSKLDGLDVRVKDDATLLTEADLAVERRIIELIRSVDPDGTIVAEEDSRSTERVDVLDRPDRIWVIDPIDGTAQFVKASEREYCSVICLVENLTPVATLIIAPELGTSSTPMIVSTLPNDTTPSLNGRSIEWPHTPAKWISATRSSDSSPRSIESNFATLGYSVKTRTTSQTLDMLRTAINIDPYTDLNLPSFALFYRKKQKVWDGLAGLCLGQKRGLRSTDDVGRPRLPVSIEIMSHADPQFESTLMGVFEVNRD